MTLNDAAYGIMNRWRLAFSQKRTLINAIRLAFCLMLNPSRNTITQSLVYGGLENEDWSSAYKVFSRSKWKDSDLFRPVIEETISYFPDHYISLAVDDTKIKKTGRKIPYAQYYRDPLSPPFHANLLYGHRILQFSALLPLYRGITPDPDDADRHYHVSRGIPVLANNVPALKKPGRRATAEEVETYHRLKGKNSLGLAFLENVRQLREAYDGAGATDKTLLIVADGSFCNSTVFKAELERTCVVARCRMDARLCTEDTSSSRRFYSQATFTPLSVRQDDSIKYKKTKLYLGKKLRQVKYKEIDNVLWRRGAGRKKLRLIVIAPKPYHSSGRKQLYKQEAYILTDNHDLSAEVIIQQYFNRWEIEVNHRDEKNNLGLGQAQVWNCQSVIKLPALLIASYSIMLLASLKCYGPKRTGDYLPQPKWRRNSARPSCNDLVNLMRKELASDLQLQQILNIHLTKETGLVVNQ